jgi:precorrin-8X/cobalt-precorrin-8 methylmutase
MSDYVRDGAEIYRRSFAIIRAEADLARFSQVQARVVVRMIHACGLVELADDIEMSDDFEPAARGALLAGRPILCDAEMVAHGVTRARLPAQNGVICTLRDPQTPTRWSFGATAWPGLSWRSAMRPQRSFACWS